MITSSFLTPSSFPCSIALATPWCVIGLSLSFWSLNNEGLKAHSLNLLCFLSMLMGHYSSPMILNITRCQGSLIFIIGPMLFLEHQAPIANYLHNSTWILYALLRLNILNIKILISPPNLLSCSFPHLWYQQVYHAIAEAKYLWNILKVAFFYTPHSFLLKFCWLYLWIHPKSYQFHHLFCHYPEPRIINSLLDNWLDNTKDQIIK